MYTRILSLLNATIKKYNCVDKIIVKLRCSITRTSDPKGFRQLQGEGVHSDSKRLNCFSTVT